MAYTPHTPEDRRAMLAALGLDDVEELFADIPAAVRLRRPLHLPPALSEPELLAHLGDLAERNAGARLVCFAGAGAYDHFVPSVVRSVVQRGEFLTSYTPYQPEVSQGTLQVIYEFQTAICELTGLDVANASLYDGASALAEAALVACAATGRDRVLAARSVNPRHREVLRTYARGQAIRVEEVELDARRGTVDLAALERALAAGEAPAAVAVQHPNYFGVLEPVTEVAALAHSAGALVVASVHPISLGLLAPPGEWGADLAVGEGQPLGTPLQFGGPYLGFLASRQSLLRRLPGRIAGRTADATGREGFVLTLQAREQHIRRARATSNICTNQALVALAATVYLAWAGPGGLRQVAELCLEKAHHASEGAAAAGFPPLFAGPFWAEWAVRSPLPAAEVRRRLAEVGYLVGPTLAEDFPELGEAFLISVTERRTRAELDGLCGALADLAGPAGGGSSW
ncbi:MAG: aminomethyl-transferring glycine dehydrogenase subunit GcvPA [Clostridia bacterium]|nr:aminomethyl-transferring glycine dehydrogenase subunit GcvPA [Clostridia bacterium]